VNLERVIAVRNDKTVYRDGGVCVKVFHENYSKADILSEALNGARIEETDLPIPRILGVNMAEGKWAILSEFIEGKTLSRLMAEQPERREEYLRLFVSLQIRVHETSCPLLTRLSDKLRRGIAEADLVATERYKLQVRLEELAKGSRVCHGDFWPSNIILREDGSPCILDWSRATQGDPAADAANTYLLFRMNSGDEDAERYLSLFCEMSGTAPEDVLRWVPVVAAGRSSGIHERGKDFLLSSAKEK